MHSDEILMHALRKQPSMTSREVHKCFTRKRMTEKAAQQALSRAYRSGVIRRRKAPGNNGYQYQLAAVDPKFGESYEEEVALRKDGVVEQCRSTSALVEFNNMIAGARRNHEAILVRS